MALNLFWREPLTWNIDSDLSKQIDYFDSVGSTDISNAFRGIQNEKNTLFDWFKTDLIDQFWAFEKLVNPSFDQFLRQSNTIANEVLPDIANQRQLVNQKFWPDWELTTQANDFYRGLIKSVNNSIAWQTQWAINQWGRTWASQSSINQAINQARNSWLDSLVKVQAEKLNQQQTLLNNFLKLQDWLRWQTFDYSNQLIRQPLLELNNMTTKLGSWLLSWLSWLSTAELQEALRQKIKAENEAILATRSAPVQQAKQSIPVKQQNAPAKTNNKFSMPSAKDMQDNYLKGLFNL